MLASRQLFRLTRFTGSRSTVNRMFQSSPRALNEKDQDQKSADQDAQQQEQTQEEKPTQDAPQEEAKKELTPEEQIQAEVKQLEQEVAQRKSEFLNTIAEVENLRKQTRREVDNVKSQQITNFAKSLLLFNDSLEELVQKANPETEDPAKELKKIYESVKSTRKYLDNAFEAQGIVEYNPEGAFDPKRHNALFVIPYFEGAPAGHIGQVVNSGYLIKDRILRSANVGVFAKKP